ncbi:reversion-inducing cysteine-rich protein with Kazal motifs-like [Lampetra planeri]
MGAGRALSALLPPLLLLLVARLLQLHPARAQDAACCYQARENPICREVCEQLTSTKSESRMKHLLHKLPSYCSDGMLEFWDCVNSTLPGGQKSADSWVGLSCCALAIGTDCRKACRQSASRSAVTAECRQEYEAAMFNCINRYEMGSLCCGHAGRHTNCREFCTAVFRSDAPPTPGQIRSVESYCATVSVAVVDCVDNYTRSYPSRNPVDSLHCCERAGDAACEASCRSVLHTMASEQEMVEGLIAGCGRQPLPQDPLWQCFLEGAHVEPGAGAGPGGSRRAGGAVSDVGSSPTGLDGAKLQCCSRATSPLCRELCVGLFSTSWGSAQRWQEFERECEYREQEAPMKGCLADVHEPCQLGCKDLSYCTNFNNRPTELFRSCNAQADQGALNDMRLWEHGAISMPFLSIPVRDVRRCRPEAWKAIACVLQVKPCHGATPSPIICRSDCVDILQQCGDSSRFSEGQTAEGICEALSPSDDADACIPLSRYLGVGGSGTDGSGPPRDGDNNELGGSDEVVHPCNPSPCPGNQLCEVNRRGCSPGVDCLPYVCAPGCKLGEASDFLVRRGSVARVPVASGEAGCYRLCECGEGGRLENCKEMPCIDSQRSCIVGGKREAHGSHFHVDCNVCACYAGRLTCSQRQCFGVASSEEDRRRYTGLPCHCVDQFVPVCAATGRTFPSACVARCAGLLDSQFEYGTCASRDPCLGNPCGSRQRCIPRRRVCLTSLEPFGCKQFECLHGQLACEAASSESACDTADPEHPLLCSLYGRGKTLPYVGPCQRACRLPGQSVCGHDGETYTSVCAAHSARVAVDYMGPCRAVGLLPRHGAATPECDPVTCPPLPVAGCQPVTPPGACCPLCAGMLRILWSMEQLDMLARVSGRGAISQQDVVTALRSHVSVPQCDAFGFLSIENDLVLLVLPVDQQPTALQIEACSKEAEKIGALVNSGSPVLVSHTPLSALLAAQVLVSTGCPSAAPPRTPPPGRLTLLLAALLLAATLRLVAPP